MRNPFYLAYTCFPHVKGNLPGCVFNVVLLPIASAYRRSLSVGRFRIEIEKQNGITIGQDQEIPITTTTTTMPTTITTTTYLGKQAYT